MENLQLFAVTDGGVKPISLPSQVTSFDQLFVGLSLGVYSALRTFGHNKFLGLDNHIARTVTSMQILGWDYELDELQLRQALHEVCSAYPQPESRVRFDILAKASTHWGTNRRVLITLSPLVPVPSCYYDLGVSVDIVRSLTRLQPLAKTAHFAVARQAYELGTRDMYERLLLNDQEQILEGTNTNFYGVIDGVLYTAKEGMLEGITRNIILELAVQLNIPAVLEAIHIKDIPRLDEAALSGSSRALMPVVNIAGQPVGNGSPGPVCRHLMQAYNEYVASHVKTAI